VSAGARPYAELTNIGTAINEGAACEMFNLVEPILLGHDLNTFAHTGLRAICAVDARNGQRAFSVTYVK